MRVLLKEVVAIKINGVTVETGADAIGTGVDDVGAKQSGIAFIGAAMHIKQRGEVCARRRKQELRAAGQFVETFVAILFACEGIVDIGVTLLGNAGDAKGEFILEDRQVHRSFEFARIVVAVRATDVAFELMYGLCRVELDDTARRIAAEQCALWTTQDFDRVEIEHREAFEDRAFIRDIIIDQRNRLGSVEIKIGVADAANVETRERAAEGAFRDDAGHAGREEAHIRAGGFQHVELFVGNGRDRNRHVLDVFFDALGGHGDGGQAGFGIDILSQCGKRCGGEQAGAEQ